MTAVELGLIAPVLMLFVMGCAELGLMAAAQSLLDAAAFSAARTGKVGYVAAGKTQAQMVTDAVTKSVANYLDPTKITITSLAYKDYSDVGQPEPYSDDNKNGKRDSGESFTDVNENGVWDSDQGKTGLGATGQIVLYTLSYNWKFFTPMIGKFFGAANSTQLKSRIAVRNEPY